MKQVTLCIPLYNAETTIARTLDSLVAQSYPVFKIKVFDNVSTDNGRNLVLDYAKRFPIIELHESETNVGAEGNFTKCLLAAEGDYSAIVHSDDLYEKDYVLKSVEALEKNPSAQASFCAAFEINSHEEVIGKRLSPLELAENEISVLSFDDLLSLVFKYGNFITCPSVMAKSQVYREEIKVWNGSKFNTSADLDVWLRLAKLGAIVAIREPLIRYRVAEASYSYRIAKKRTTRHDIFLVLDQYKNSENIADYNFLALKDQAIRNLNILRNKKRDEAFPSDVKFYFSLVVKKMFHSKWHLKMGLAILGIRFLVVLFKLMGWKSDAK